MKIGDMVRFKEARTLNQINGTGVILDISDSAFVSDPRPRRQYVTVLCNGIMEEAWLDRVELIDQIDEHSHLTV